MRTRRRIRATLGMVALSLMVGQLGLPSAHGHHEPEGDEGRDVAGPPAQEEGHPDAQPARKQSPAAADATDGELAARGSGRSTAEIQAHQQAAERLGRVQATLTQRFGGDFAGAYLDGSGRPAIRFRAEAPRGARDAIARERVDARLVEHTGRSLAELQGETDRAMQALADAAFPQAMGYVDQRSGQIVLEVLATPDARTEEQVRERLPASLSGYDVVITVHQEEFVDPEHTRGGAWMTDGGWRECTAGWSVERISDGTDGIATAAHCHGLDGYEEPGVGVYSAPWKGEHIGDWGEMEWHTTSHIELAEFFATATAIRDVLSVEPAGSIVEGEYVCIYGRSSNSRACDLQVEDTNVTVTFTYAGSTVTAKRMVRMDGDRTIAGDSGGGWSWGTRAYGIHFGDAGGKNVWSVADHLDEAIGVRVLKK